MCQLAIRAPTVWGGLTGMCGDRVLDAQARCVPYSGAAYGSPNKQHLFQERLETFY